MSKKKFANAKKRRLQTLESDIIERVKHLRLARYGPRGQVRLAHALGISPSTYHYYERSRVPPPGLLVRMAQVAKADLVWLMTGKGSLEPSGPASAGADQAVVVRAARLLEDRPGASRALAGFLDLMEQVHESEAQRRTSRVVRPPGSIRPGWGAIPVLGRTAAAVPQFWQAGKGGKGLADQMRPALEQLRAGRRTVGRTVAQIGLMQAATAPGAAALIQLVRPITVAGLSVYEILEAQDAVRRWPDAFALRVDGDSMRPVLEPDDLVILSPQEAARNGQLAVVQLRDQIGVTCKIYRRRKDRVRLIPQNPRYPTTVHPARQVAWALRVAARVRIGKPGVSRSTP